MTQVGQTSPKKQPGNSQTRLINKDLESAHPSKTNILGGKNQNSQASHLRGSSNTGSRGGILQYGNRSEDQGISQEDNQQFEIELDDPYEDDDFKIYFDKGSLLNHIT